MFFNKKEIFLFGRNILAQAKSIIGSWSPNLSVKKRKIIQDMLGKKVI